MFTDSSRDPSSFEEAFDRIFKRAFEHGARRAMRHAAHFEPFGHHRHQHHEAPFGRGTGGGPRRFGRGDLKYLILDLLQEGPSHGYDIIRAIESRFHGFYSPSAGSVYPTLQLLSDQGYVSSSERDGKRVYTITDAGLAFLKERSDSVEQVRERVRSSWGNRMGPQMREIMDDVRGLGQVLFSQGRSGGFGDAEKMRKLREIIAKARTDIEALFTSDTSEESQAQG